MSRAAITRLLVLALVAAAGLYFAGRIREAPVPSAAVQPSAGAPRPSAGPARRPAAGESGEARIVRAFEQRLSNQWVEAEGVVERILPDDRQGSRHQRFLLRLPSSGHTVLVSHNIDLSPRVRGLQVGDRVVFRGEYEWNTRGGVIHWTHRDPAGKRPGGWIEHKRRRYS